MWFTSLYNYYILHLFIHDLMTFVYSVINTLMNALATYPDWFSRGIHFAEKQIILYSKQTLFYI